MKTTLLWLMAVLVLPAALAAQTEPKSRPPTATAPPEGSVRAPAGRLRISGRVDVGETAPGFELTNAYGERVKLSRYRGDQVLLAFADRRETFSPFEAVAESLRSMGVLLVGVCHGSPHSLRALAEHYGLRFDLLSDPTGEVAAVYGAYDFATSTMQPGYVLVGRRGKVRMALLGQALRPNDLLQITRYALTLL
jgi:peroxiredoxin